MAKHDKNTPGLKTMKRHNGRLDFYWVADEKLVKNGFTPKTVRLHYDDDEAGRYEMGLRCQALQAQMFQWAGGQDQSVKGSPYGSIAWLIEQYQRDEDSPYHAVRESTKGSYDHVLSIILNTVGDRRLQTLNGRDFRRWYKEWRAPAETGGSERIRRAYGCIQLLRIIIKYGASLRDPSSMELARVLAEMEFENVAKRHQRISYEQTQAFYRAAREMGFPSMARAMAIQFSAFLRQKDVIGEWVRDEAAKGGIMFHGQRWQWGLMWGDHISADLILRKPTSKSNGKEVAEHDLKLYPDVVAQLADSSRVGPVIIDEGSGRPYMRRHFADRFRMIARAAGIPDDVWNMDARAGAVSESYDAGADPADVMRSATHTQMATSMGYNRGGLEKTTRVANLRNGARRQS